VKKILAATEVRALPIMVMGTSANVLKDIMGTIVKKVNVIRECKKIKNKDP
jgi:hypothetical protein